MLIINLEGLVNSQADVSSFHTMIIFAVSFTATVYFLIFPISGIIE